MNSLVVGIIQDEFNTNPVENSKKIAEFIDNYYSEADIVITPEYSMLNILRNLTPEQVYEYSEELENSAFLSKLSDIASRAGVYILTHFVEKTDTKPKCYSSSVLVKPSGGVERIYSKIHLFDAYGYRESNYFKPGNSLSKTIVVSNKKFYVAICYDIRFPELFRTYAYMNAHGVFIQAGWVKSFLKEELLDTLARSRSHENTVFIILANQTGDLFTGRSSVYNPFGFKEVDLGFKPQYREHTIDLSQVDEARKQIPVIKQAVDKWSISFKQ